MTPFSAFRARVYHRMVQVGPASEDPSEGGVNDVPLSAICRNIEIDMRGMLGKTAPPPSPQPVEDVLP